MYIFYLVVLSVSVSTCFMHAMEQQVPLAESGDKVAKLKSMSALTGQHLQQYRRDELASQREQEQIQAEITLRKQQELEQTARMRQLREQAREVLQEVEDDQPEDMHQDPSVGILELVQSGECSELEPLATEFLIRRAIESGEPTELKKLLDEKRITACLKSVKDYQGKTPLHWVVHSSYALSAENRLTMLQMLMQSGLQINKDDKSSCTVKPTPAHVSIAIPESLQGSIDVVQFRENIRVLLTTPGQDGKTGLHKALVGAYIIPQADQLERNDTNK